MWYIWWIGDIFQGIFLFIIPVFFVIIIVLLYQNVYGKSEKRPNLLNLYAKVMIWVLSFVVLIMAAKIGDDIIDKNFMLKYDQLNQESSFYVDTYMCNQRFGIYVDPQTWLAPEWDVLSKDQIETCRVEQIERQKQYSKLDRENILYKNIYRLWFFSLLLIIHIILNYIWNRRGHE